MKKIILFIFMFISIANANALYQENSSDVPFELNSKYAYVYNIKEDRVMYEIDSKKEIPIASLTKIMTAIVAIENSNLDKEVTIIDYDLRDMYEYAVAGFEVLDKVTIRDLLYGVLLPSGSDAVNALVRSVSDSEEDFVNLMNKKVQELNLNNTRFSNAIGKDDDNYSSMYDISRILEYALQNDVFKEIFSTKEYVTNGLLLKGPLTRVESNLIKGAKTGFTYAAMYCFASFSKSENLDYIVVTAYAESYKDVIEDHTRIYSYYNDNYNYYDYNINFDIEIKNGKDNFYNVNIDKVLYLENNYNEVFISTKYNGIDMITKDLKKGDKLGVVDIYYNNNLIDRFDVYLEEELEYKNYYLYIILILPITLIFVLLLRKKKKR